MNDLWKGKYRMRKSPVDGRSEVWIGGAWVMPETLSEIGFDYEEAEMIKTRLTSFDDDVILIGNDRDVS